jgi:hypothetical protein
MTVVLETWGVRVISQQAMRLEVLAAMGPERGSFPDMTRV